MDSKAQQAGPLNLPWRESSNCWPGIIRKIGGKRARCPQHTTGYTNTWCWASSHAPGPSLGPHVVAPGCHAALPANHPQPGTRHRKLLSFINILIDIGFYCKRHHFLLIWVLEWHWQAGDFGSKQTLRGKGKYIPKNNNWKEANSIIDFVWYRSGTSSRLPVIFRFWWRQQVCWLFVFFYCCCYKKQQQKENFSIV